MENLTSLPLIDDPGTGWPVAGLLIESLTRRDFTALERCLVPATRFRALTPRGIVELDTAAEIADRFRTWFGGDDAFEVIDASLGQIGTRLYVRWRVRMVPADGAARVVEQHAFTTGSELVESIDLVCSGFHAETLLPAAS